jgi:beta-phosphoglucomutase
MPEGEIPARINNKIAFIFDMDGTLVDNMRYHSQAWMALFESLGIQLDADEFQRRTAGKTNPEILREIAGRNMSDEEVRALSDQKENYYRKLYKPHLAAISGLLPFLDKARNLEIPLGLATAAGQENIHFILHGLNLGGFFSAIVGADEIRHGKPDPEIFIKTAKKLHIQAEKCIVFEDSLLGIEAASRAGMQSILVTTSHQLDELSLQHSLLFAVEDFSALDIHDLI